MELNDFLKCKKVRCVDGDATIITTGKVYDVIGLDKTFIHVTDDNGEEACYWYCRFEPVIDPAENPLQDVELTPEFESAETVLVYNCEVNTQDNSVNTQDNSVNIQDTPKFRVGDPVYCPLQTKELCKVFSNDQEFQPQCPLTITEVRSRHSGVSGAVVACVDDYGYSDEYDNAPFIFHATPENHALLSKLYPHIDFEQPTTQADIDNAAVDKLAQAMKDKLAEKREQGYHGWETCKHSDLVQLLINHVDKGDPIDVANFCAFLFARGEPLTQGGTR